MLCLGAAGCGGGGGGGGSALPPAPGPTPVPTFAPALAGDVVMRYLDTDGTALAYDPDDRILLGAAANRVFDTASNGRLAVLPDGYLPALAYDTKNHAIYVASTGTIYHVTLQGAVTTYATGFTQIKAMAFDPAGTMYVVDRDHVATVVNGVTRQLTAAGTIGGDGTFSPEQSRAAYDTRNGLLYVTDPVNYAVKSVSANGTTALVAGGTPGDIAGIGAAARFGRPVGIAYDADDDLLYVTDFYNDQLWSLTANGNAAIVAGFGTPGVVDGNGRYAFFANPADVAYAPDAHVAFVGQGYIHFGVINYIVSSYATRGSAPPAHVFPYRTWATGAAVTGPVALATAPDGTVWFPEFNPAAIGSISTDGTLSERAFLRGWSQPQHIAVDGDGAAWVSASHFAPILDGAALLRFSPNGTQTDFPLPSIADFVVAMMRAPDGNPWVSYRPNPQPALAEIDRATGAFTNFPGIPSPQAMAVAGDGNVWLSEGAFVSPTQSGALVKVDPHGNQIGSSIPTFSAAIGMTVASDGSVWYSNGHEVVARVANGVETRLPLCSGPGCFTTPLAFAAAPDGSVWFTESNPGEVAHAFANGTIVRYLPPSQGLAFNGIALRPDGKLWLSATPNTILLFDPAAYEAAGVPHAAPQSVRKEPMMRFRGVSTAPR